MCQHRDRAVGWSSRAEHPEHLPGQEKHFAAFLLPSAAAPSAGRLVTRARSWQVLGSCSPEPHSPFQGLSTSWSHSSRLRAGWAPCPSLCNCLPGVFAAHRAPTGEGDVMFFRAHNSDLPPACSNTQPAPRRSPTSRGTNQAAAPSRPPASPRCHLRMN